MAMAAYGPESVAGIKIMLKVLGSPLERLLITELQKTTQSGCSENSGLANNPAIMTDIASGVPEGFISVVVEA